MPKILLIDDEKQVLDMLKLMLERADHEVSTASNGDEGLRLFRQKDFDIVLTDLFMDTKDGLSTIMSMRKESDTPIIAISGGGWSSASNYLDVAQKMGVSCTFNKPVSNKQLLAAIERLTTQE